MQRTARRQERHLFSRSENKLISDPRSEVLRGGGDSGGTMGISACGQPAVGECDAITPAMPIFILSGICIEMGVSAENSEEPKTRVEHVVSRCLHAACTFLAG